MALTPDEQRKQDETNAALARSQSFTDGRRRVVALKDQSVTLGHSMLTFKANEIIEDPYRIALMESYDIEFIELNVNDRKKIQKADESKGESLVRTDNVNALARGLGVDRDVLRDALAGAQPQIDRAVAIIRDACVAESLAPVTPEADDDAGDNDANDANDTGGEREGDFEPGTPAV